MIQDIFIKYTHLLNTTRKHEYYSNRKHQQIKPRLSESFYRASLILSHRKKHRQHFIYLSALINRKTAEMIKVCLYSTKTLYPVCAPIFDIAATTHTKFYTTTTKLCRQVAFIYFRRFESCASNNDELFSLKEFPRTAHFQETRESFIVPRNHLYRRILKGLSFMVN